MIVQNSPELQFLLKSWPNLQKQSTFVIDDKEFQRHYKECEKQHPEESLEYRHLRAILRCLTINSKAIAVENAVQHHHYSHDGWFKWVVLALLVLLILLVASQRAHAQNVTPAIAVANCGTQALTAGQPTHLTVNLTGAECTSSSGVATVVLGTTTGTGVIGTVLQGSPPWTVDLTRVNGQTAATNGAGVLAVAGATSPGLIIQGQGNGGTPVTVSFVTANVAVNQTQWNGTTAATAVYNSGAAVVIGFQTASISTNVAQWAGTAAATTPYNSGAAVVVGFQTSSLSIQGQLNGGTPVTVSFVTANVAVNQAQINGTATATNGNGIQAVAGATSAGLIVQGQGNGGTPVTVTWPTASIAVTPAANSSVNVSQVNAQTAATNGAGVLAVAGSTSAGLIIQGQGNGGTPVTVSWVTATPGVTVTGTVATGGSVTATNPVFIGGYGNSGKIFPVVVCDNNVQGGGVPAFLTGQTAGTTQIIAAPVSPKRIGVCAYTINASTAVVQLAKFVYGTGTNCATGGTDAGPTLSTAANAILTVGSGSGILFAVPVGQALCVNSSSATPVLAVSVTYTIFGVLLPPGSFRYRRHFLKKRRKECQSVRQRQ